MQTPAAPAEAVQTASIKDPGVPDKRPGGLVGIDKTVLCFYACHTVTVPRRPNIGATGSLGYGTCSLCTECTYYTVFTYLKSIYRLYSMYSPSHK